MRDDPPKTADEPAMTPLDAILSRRSVRAFRPDPVPLALVQQIISAAARAPSGSNMQPWYVTIVSGEARDRLCQSVLHAFDNNDPGPEMEYQYYPDSFFEPYRERRKQIGVSLYGLLDIAKGDAAAMHRQHGRNYRFFDAPVGIICSIDKRLEIGSWLDYGTFIGNILTAARQFGLHSCAQAAWAAFPGPIRRTLDLPETRTIVCGIALGYEDSSAPENQLRTDRADLSEWADFRGFNDTAS